MTTVSNGIWSGILEDLERHLSAQALETWLRPLHFQAATDSTLRISAPNQFHLQYVEDKFGSLLRESVVRRLGPGGRIEMVVNGASSSPIATNDPWAAPDPGPAHPGSATGAGADPAEDREVAEYTSRLSRATERPSRPKHETTPLNPKYTFEAFVVGKSNQFAHAAALAVAQHPAVAYNPLFIFGGSGLGKTHIMQAIGNAILREKPDTLVHYASAENFMNEMIGAIQGGVTFDFRNKYRKIDVLLIDDIHFLQGKESTQEEFFHTFNALHGAHKQIVLTSDRPPKEIPTLEERLVSRFEWGLVTDIQAPDLETRIAILRKKAEQDNLEIADDVMEFIASNVRSNIRELEGSLIRLLAFSSLTDSEIDVDLAREVLKDFLKRPDTVVSVERIQKVVADHYGIPEEAMKVKKRTSSLAFPRQIAMYLARELTSLSYSEIGSRFGGRDHTTVMHACEKIGTAREGDHEVRRSLQRLSSTLRT
jgi:chromosomal replication initiator protein